MTESVIADMLTRMGKKDRIDVKKFYKDYRDECKNEKVDPIFETYYFYRSGPMLNPKLKFVIEDGKYYWVKK